MNLQTITHCVHSTVKHKGSTFLGFLYPIADFQKGLDELHAIHPKAAHFVTSKRFFNDNFQIEERFSDDGEPRGSSGMPTLNVLRGAQLINIGFVSVRYFGGTLLGIGGLVRAYTDSALCTLSLASIVPFVHVSSRRLHVSFAQLKHAQYLIHKFKIECTYEDFDSKGAWLLLQANDSILDEFMNILEHS